MKIIYVYENWSTQAPVLIGRLYVDVIKGTESYSFEYDDNWLKNCNLLILDPTLNFYKGRQYSNDKFLFGLFTDSAPDRWGRQLMNKMEKVNANIENRKPRKLFESDYLLGVYDESRMGALRFSLLRNGPFLSEDDMSSIPPWTTLRTLEEASRNIENEDFELNNKWLNQLIRPGSSLGGARPKATIKDQYGDLWIAKFPSKNDDMDIGLWEKVVHDLAKLCGLDVPESKIEKFSKFGSTFLVKRFDRKKGRRIHFTSAMTMLGKRDGSSAADGVSYLDIVSFIKSYGKTPKKDLVELWKRIVFNMVVSNTDDHLRNHGFLLDNNGWILSPLFDVNPVPYGSELSLNVTENDNTISIDLAIETAPYYNITKEDALKISNEIINIVKNNWQQIAKNYGLSRNQIEIMKPAFSICYQ